MPERPHYYSHHNAERHADKYLDHARGGFGNEPFGDTALADLGIEPKRRLALPAWESIKLAVRRGHGIAAFSRLALTEELDAGALVVIPFVPWKVRRTFSIVRIRDAALTPAAHKFHIDVTQEAGTPVQ